MANEQQLKLLNQGVEAWNKWRNENIDIEINLEGAILIGAPLEGARLGKAHLERAILIGAQLEGTYLLGAHLEGANLGGAHLEGANLRAAQLEGAYLGGAHLEGAQLRGANFNKADVSGVRYNRWGRYQGIRVDSCFGSPRFKRFAQDQDFIEEFRSSKLRYPLYLLWLILADCGRNIFLWAGWSIAFAIGFALQFYSMGEGAFDLKDLPWSKSTMIYYSVVTFTTLGLGDVTPKTPEAAWWVMAEVILGYIMLGGLISILATMLARRS